MDIITPPENIEASAAVGAAVNYRIILPQEFCFPWHWNIQFMYDCWSVIEFLHWKLISTWEVNVTTMTITYDDVWELPPEDVWNVSWCLSFLLPLHTNDLRLFVLFAMLGSIVWVCAWNFQLHVWPKQSTNFVEWMNEVAIFGHKLPHSQTHKNFVFSFPVRRGCNYGTTFCTYNLSIQLLKKWHFLDLVRQAAQVTRRDSLDFPYLGRKYHKAKGQKKL